MQSATARVSQTECEWLRPRSALSVDGPPVRRPTLGQLDAQALPVPPAVVGLGDVGPSRAWRSLKPGSWAPGPERGLGSRRPFGGIHRVSTRAGMGPPAVIVNGSARGKPGSNDITRRRRTTLARPSVASSIAKWSPMHERAPAPNGRNCHRSRPRARSVLNRAGSKAPGRPTAPGLGGARRSRR